MPASGCWAGLHGENRRIQRDWAGKLVRMHGRDISSDLCIPRVLYEEALACCPALPGIAQVEEDTRQPGIGQAALP